MSESLNLTSRIKKIKLVTFDCDGVLTDGGIHYSSAGAITRVFHALDGQGLKYLQKAGFIVAIITASTSDIIRQRAQDLGLDHIYSGYFDKLEAWEELKAIYKTSDEQMCHIGDDMPDFPLVQRAGLGVSVPNGIEALKKIAHYVTTNRGGHGAARELAELLIDGQK